MPEASRPTPVINILSQLTDSDSFRKFAMFEPDAAIQQIKQLPISHQAEVLATPHNVRVLLYSRRSEAVMDLISKQPEDSITRIINAQMAFVALKEAERRGELKVPETWEKKYAHLREYQLGW